MKKIALTMVLITFITLSVYASQVLMVYCGTTMVNPMQEIATMIEDQHACKVKILKGGSGDLMEKLLKLENGDLYLPGSDSYIKTLNNDHEGLVVKSETVGLNKAALFVKKGNPKGVKSDINELLNPNLAVVIGAADSGSIGKTTKSLLEKAGIYEAVIARANQTKDSAGIFNALKAGKADVSINWYAASTWEGNREIVDAVALPEAYQSRKNLVLAVLSTSKNPEIADAFLTLAASEEGHEIFKKYGLAE